MIMKNPKKIPFGIILAFVFATCSTKAKQIWPFNFLEWPNSLSFYCTYFLCGVTLLHVRKKSLWSSEFRRGFFNLLHYLSRFCLWGWDQWHLSEAMPGEGTFCLMGTFSWLRKKSLVCSEIFNVLPLWRTTVNNWPLSRSFLLSLRPCKLRNTNMVGSGL